MSRNSGYSVTFTNANGEQKKGVAYHRDQSTAFRSQNKIVVRETDDKGNVVKSNGREVVFIKNKDEVKQNGFID